MSDTNITIQFHSMKLFQEFYENFIEHAYFKGDLMTQKWPIGVKNPINKVGTHKTMCI